MGQMAELLRNDQKHVIRAREIAANMTGDDIVTFFKHATDRIAEEANSHHGHVSLRIALASAVSVLSTLILLLGDDAFEEYMALLNVNLREYRHNVFPNGKDKVNGN